MASYDGYNAYLSIKPSTLQGVYQQKLQTYIDKQFSNASNFYTIEVESPFGSLNWENIDARIDHIINSKTGKNLGDDFKKLMFQNISSTPLSGTRYRFDDQIWMVYNTDNYKSVTNACAIRRCNYTLKWTNENDEVIQQPVIIDYFRFITNENVDESKFMRIGAGLRYIFLQNNDESYKLVRDKRFIIDRKVYRIVDYDSITIPGIYQITVEEQQVNNATDDIVNGIADAYDVSTNNSGTLW